MVNKKRQQSDRCCRGPTRTLHGRLSQQIYETIRTISLSLHSQATLLLFAPVHVQTHAYIAQNFCQGLACSSLSTELQQYIIKNGWNIPWSKSMKCDLNCHQNITIVTCALTRSLPSKNLSQSIDNILSNPAWERDKQTHSQTDRQTNRQTDRSTGKPVATWLATQQTLQRSVDVVYSLTPCCRQTVCPWTFTATDMVSDNKGCV